MKNKKIRVGIVFGGKSSEHEVSLLSAKTVHEALDKERYDPVLIGIDKAGRWQLCSSEGYLLHADNPKMVSLKSSEESFALSYHDSNEVKTKLDVVFPVLHGSNGEDGTIQGLLKLSGIPFVGAGVLGSSVGMDKDVMKRLLRDASVPIAPFLTFHDFERPQISFEEIADTLGLPFFVKPANSGSSIGISKVKSRQDFIDALDLAFSYDRKILIEEYIKGREIECSVMGNDHPIASLPGEVIAQDEFNSWDAKYVDDCCRFIIPVPMDPEQLSAVQRLAVKAYRVLCCEGMARVDFFLTEKGQLLVNEINTIPGFTKLSVYPRLWEASGISYSELIDKLIGFALERHDKESLLITSYAPQPSSQVDPDTSTVC